LCSTRSRRCRRSCLCSNARRAARSVSPSRECRSSSSPPIRNGSGRSSCAPPEPRRTSRRSASCPMRRTRKRSTRGSVCPGVRRGSEVDIRSDGELDLPDDILGELDWVQLSLHAGQRQPRDELTRKVTEAMRHPAVRALSHPKGRIINHRPPNALDLERTFEVALETGVALETNGLPDRLDLSGPEIRL